MSDYIAPGHTQKMPDVWPDLLDMSNGLVVAYPDGLTREAGLQLHNDLDMLSNEELEQARYFALGEVACVLNGRLREPDIRSRIVERATNRIVGGRGVYFQFHPPRDKRHQGMYRTELYSPAIADGTESTVVQALSILSPGVRQIADVLEAAEDGRRQQQQFGKRVMSESDDLIWVTGAGRAVKAINGNMFAAATNIFDLLIEASLPDGRKSEDCLIHDVLDLPNLNISKPTVVAANGAAWLHLDEIRMPGLRRYITSPGAGMLKFDRSRVAESPERIPADRPEYNDSSDATAYKLWLGRALHDQRIGCPALYVRQLIPQVMEMVPEVILGVEERTGGIGAPLT